MQYLIRPRKIHENASNCYFSMTTDRSPTDDEVAQAQRVAGFDPIGYGNPGAIQRTEERPGEHYTFWRCSNYCG